MPIILPSQLERLEAHEVPAEYSADALDLFIEGSRRSAGAELANAQTIVSELCRALRVPPPSLKQGGGDNPYCFEEDVKVGRAHGRIDCYKRGHFVFEAKQGTDAQPTPDELSKALRPARVGHSKSVRGAGRRGSQDWIDAMRQGRHQAGSYAVEVARRGDPKPPFLLVADLGHRLWIWSSFSPDLRDDYGDFEPDACFPWDDLARPELFSFLRRIWLDPAALNEEARGQRVTAEIAEFITGLAVRLERRFDARPVGDFLMKCVFTMFAEGVDFIPEGLFKKSLDDWVQRAKAGHPEFFVKGLRTLWARMNEGGSLESGHSIRRFNGYLFKDPEPLPLTLDELEALQQAAQANWRRVSPAIFGTLLERALARDERQRLGAHYTPEAYIQRLVEHTLIRPLRDEWTVARAEMELLQRTAKEKDKPRAGRAGKGKQTSQQRALERGHAFRKYLAGLRVLDPACGSGNFLYVALKEMKRLEGEVVRALSAAGDRQIWLDIPGETVHPDQFLGIELKPWAAKIAELVLWIGYLQWQVSSDRVRRMPDPVLKDVQHISNRDALITWQGEERVHDAEGREVQVARGVTRKRGQRDLQALRRLLDVQIAAWPDADFIVGNPPFLGNKRLNDVLDPAYVTALRDAFPAVPGTADLVMYWWWRCADLVAKKRLRRFGLVTTNSITGKFNRAVVADALAHTGLRLAYAIADHPWFDEGADVRIAMTVGDAGPGPAILGVVRDERHTSAKELEQVRVGEAAVPVIHADLSSGAAVSEARPLRANQGLCFQGVNLVGTGFRLSPDELGKLGYAPGRLPPVIKPYLIGRDLVQRLEEKYVIDFYGLDPEQAQTAYPRLWDRLARLVWKERQKNNRESRRTNWWLFGEPVGKWRTASAGLPRYIATSRTARHRLFVLIDADTLPDTKVVAIALDNAPAFLALLSSRVHLAWARRTGGWLGVGNDSTYNHLECFGQFPFPPLSALQVQELLGLGSRLDGHRKARQQEFPALGLTDLYNVLEKLRARAPLSPQDELVRDRGLVDTLLQIHHDIDRAALAAYGWPADLGDEQIIERLVALNAERAAEEERGQVRWLRPSFQQQVGKQQAAAPDPEEEPRGVEVETSVPPRDENSNTRRSWPDDLPGRIRVLLALLRAQVEPLSTAQIQAAFKASGARPDEVELILHCVTAADAVLKTQLDSGETTWTARV